MTILARAALLALLPMLATCGEPGPNNAAQVPSAATKEQGAATTPKAKAQPQFRLAGPADPESVAAAMDVADHAMREAAAIPAQSFRIMSGDRHVATLVSGKGQPIDGSYAGCFTALVQDGKTSLVSTIGSGEWEAQTCLATTSVGILAVGATVTIGVIADAASPNAQGREPIVLRWEPLTGSLSIEEKLTRQASLAGAGTIDAIRLALAAPAPTTSGQQ